MKLNHNKSNQIFGLWPERKKKTSQSRVGNQQTQTTIERQGRNRTHATLVETE